MVHARQMEHSVQHQDSQFFFDRVSALGRLRRGAVEGDRQLTGFAVGGRKREHVSRVIFAAKLSIQLAQLCIICDQARYGASAARAFHEFVQEGFQRSSAKAPAKRARGMAK
jgi:hypothetical protein